jgi:hypothetical protein
VERILLHLAVRQTPICTDKSPSAVRCEAAAHHLRTIAAPVRLDRARRSFIPLAPLSKRPYNAPSTCTITRPGSWPLGGDVLGPIVHVSCAATLRDIMAVNGGGCGVFALDVKAKIVSGAKAYLPGFLHHTPQGPPLHHCFRSATRGARKRVSSTFLLARGGMATDSGSIIEADC